MAKSKIATPSSASKVFVLILIGASIVLLVALAAGVFDEPVNKRDFRNNLVDKDTVQAVHLADGRVYFGNVVFSDDSAVIANTHYVNDVDAEATEASLIKHGSEGYQPTGDIILNNQQVLFWENLQDDSIVTQTILDNSGGE